ncbi:MAG TPA: 50S ribosomal protein L29 [Candidatus Limnocylindrales bacterium]|nr:50S ribosomal protein L29 [Candidatus Limnocylindrales bacterium]
MLPTEVRKLSEAELGKRVQELREKVARLTMKRNARRLDKPSELIAARRDLARMLTIAGEKRRSAVKGVK